MPKPIFPEDLRSPRTVRTILRESFEGRAGIGVNIIRSIINLVINFSHHSTYPTKIYRESPIPHIDRVGSFSRRETTLVDNTQNCDYALHVQRYMYDSDNARVVRLAPGQIFAPFPDELAGRSVGRSAYEVDNTTTLATNVLHGHTRVSSWSD